MRARRPILSSFARFASGCERKRATPCVWYVCADETGGETWSTDEEVLQRQVRLGRRRSRLVLSETDIPGLATEAASVAAMTRKLRSLIPEMLALNEGAAAVEVPVELLWHKQEVISIKRV